MCGRRDEVFEKKRLLTEKWLPLLLDLSRVVCSPPYPLSEGHSGSADGGGTRPGWSPKTALGFSAPARISVPKVPRLGHPRSISTGLDSRGRGFSSRREAKGGQH